MTTELLCIAENDTSPHSENDCGHPKQCHDEGDHDHPFQPPTEPVCGIGYKPRAKIDYWKWCKLEKDHAGLHGQEWFQPTSGEEGK